MEALWEDFTLSPESFESPDWHNTLEERRQRIAEGKAHFTDWEAAKSAIRTKVP